MHELIDKNEYIIGERDTLNERLMMEKKAIVDIFLKTYNYVFGDERTRVNELYNKFDNLFYEIMTNNGETSLFSSKTHICDDKIKKIQKDGTKSEHSVSFYGNSYEFGSQDQSLSSRSNMSRLRTDDLLYLIGNKIDSINDVISNYYSKRDKINRFHNIIKEFDYHKNPLRTLYIRKHELDEDMKVVINRNSAGGRYYGGLITKDKYKYTYINEIVYIVGDMIRNSYVPYGGRVSEFHFMKNQETFKYKVIETRELPSIKDLNYMIDCKDILIDLINETHTEFDNEREKFKRFLMEVQQEFSAELISIRI